MIYVSDCSSVGVQHEQFNASFLALLKRSHPAITFFGDHAHAGILRSKTAEITFQDIEIYKKRGGFKEFIRAYHQFDCTRKLVRKAEKNAVDQLFILLIHPLAHFLLKWLVRTDVSIYLVTHGELESLKDNKSTFNKLWGWLLKKALTNTSLSVHYVVLGQSIYDNLLQILPAFRKQKASVMDHPYPFTAVHRHSRNNNQVSFSTLGVATTAKNSQYIFRIAEQMASTNHRNEYKFNICGRVYKNMEPHMNGHVHYKENWKPLSRHELETILLETDFAIFYYDNEHYSLCSSGSFWDAINAEIPLLYVENDYIDYYASLVGGIGIPFETPEKLNEYIAASDRDTLFGPHYDGYLSNIRRLKYELMSNDKLARQLSHVYA